MPRIEDGDIQQRGSQSPQWSRAWSLLCLLFLFLLRLSLVFVLSLVSDVQD